MRLYTVHVRHRGLDPDRDVALVKEGFSWPAFFFSVLWALGHRLWLAALAFVAAAAALQAAVGYTGLDPLASGALSLGLSAAFGWLGNDLRRRKLEREGFVFEGVVAGENRDGALRRFLEGSPDLARELAPMAR